VIRGEFSTGNVRRSGRPSNVLSPAASGRLRQINLYAVSGRQRYISAGGGSSRVAQLGQNDRARRLETPPVHIDKITAVIEEVVCQLWTLDISKVFLSFELPYPVNHEISRSGEKGWSRVVA
jgi:hypothetical protein